jgi:hypothetical protein
MLPVSLGYSEVKGRTGGNYPVSIGQTYADWRKLYFAATGESAATGEKFDEQRLQNMFWFRQQRYIKQTPRLVVNLRQMAPSRA